jgi:hypothetical protein
VGYTVLTGPLHDKFLRPTTSNNLSETKPASAIKILALGLARDDIIDARRRVTGRCDPIPNPELDRLANAILCERNEAKAAAMWALVQI